MLRMAGVCVRRRHLNAARPADWAIISHVGTADVRREERRENVVRRMTSALLEHRDPVR